MSRLNETQRLVIAWIGVMAGLGFGLAFGITRNYIFILAFVLIGLAVFLLRPVRILKPRLLLLTSKSIFRWLLIISLCTAVIGYTLLIRYLMIGHLQVADIVVVSIAIIMAPLFLIGVKKGIIKSPSTGKYKKMGRIYSEEEKEVDKNSDSDDLS